MGGRTCGANGLGKQEIPYVPLEDQELLESIEACLQHLKAGVFEGVLDIEDEYIGDEPSSSDRFCFVIRLGD
jgi:hypothetical protein